MKKIILIGICILSILIIGCEKTYKTSDEVLKLKFSGDFEDLAYCNIGFSGFDGYSKGSFSFIGLKGNNKRECERIEHYCHRYNNCKWKIKLSSTSNTPNKWKPKWTGNCMCEDYKININFTGKE